MPRSTVVRASLALAALASASAVGAQDVARAGDVAFLRHLHGAGALRLVAPLTPSADASDEAAADPARAGGGGRLFGDVLWIAGGSAALVASVVLATPESDPLKPAATVTRPPAGEPPPVEPGPPGGSGLDKPAAPEPPPVVPRTHVAPEPGTVLLVATGLAGVALVARRRRAR